VISEQPVQCHADDGLTDADALAGRVTCRPTQQIMQVAQSLGNRMSWLPARTRFQLLRIPDST
jgi:hypothetical protein